MQSKMKVLVIVLVVAALLTIPQTAQADDPQALVTKVSLSGKTIIISGTLPCSKWSAYAVTQVIDTRVDVTVYRKTKMPTASCAMSTKPYRVSVAPTLTAGVTYDVYVNGRYRGKLTGK